ncbi:MAG: hypothetical protein QG585_29 [Patescibacteria group bacterium]|jgi:hypothetical protein|nr:hypothetical protein [Patescibacteria group bacterium]
MENLIFKIKMFAIRNENKLSIGALVFGFIVDNLTLRRSDLLAENLVLLAYILIAGTGILIQNRSFEKDPERKKHHTPSMLLMQFAFGGLWSAFLIFYTRSATLEVSWPFILLMLLALLGNEVWKKHYLRLPFQIGGLFLAIYAMSIFLVPIFIKSIGGISFVLSGILAVIIILGILKILKFFAPTVFERSRKKTYITIAVVALLLNVFYVFNIIPPLPLVLKDAGAYHNLTRTSQNIYTMYEDKERWYQFFMRPTLKLLPGESAYVFSAIYSPQDLNIPVVHHWQYFDYKEARWVSSSKIDVPIFGGRETGYKMYSFKNSVFPGLWRVDIETLRGQTIGRVKFNIKRVETREELITVVK